MPNNEIKSLEYSIVNQSIPIFQYMHAVLSNLVMEQVA